MQFFMYCVQDANGGIYHTPWKAVHEQFRRWKKQGVFEKMNYDITKYSRSKMERNEEPSACIVDSQSVKTTEKGGQKATMEQKKLKVERARILRVLYWDVMWELQMKMTEMELR